MLRIRPSQVHAFQRHFDSQLAVKIARILSRTYPAETKAIGSEMTLHLVAEALTRGRSVGFRSERELCALAEFWLVDAPNAAVRGGEAQRILKDLSVAPLDRVDQLWAVLRPIQ
ncbi:MAG: hypothetical protein U1G07_16050 [Verrucomicrobiota bacterium]